MNITMPCDFIFKCVDPNGILQQGEDGEEPTLPSYPAQVILAMYNISESAKVWMFPPHIACADILNGNMPYIQSVIGDSADDELDRASLSAVRACLVNVSLQMAQRYSLQLKCTCFPVKVSFNNVDISPIRSK